MHTSVHMKTRRQLGRSLFSLSTIWISGSERGSLGFKASVSTAKSSCCSVEECASSWGYK